MLRKTPLSLKHGSEGRSHPVEIVIPRCNDYFNYFAMRFGNTVVTVQSGASSLKGGFFSFFFRFLGFKIVPSNIV